MRMRTSYKLKMQENIASMSLTFWLVIYNHACNEISTLQLMHVHMWNSHKCEIGKGRVNRLLVKTGGDFQILRFACCVMHVADKRHFLKQKYS